MHENYMIKSIIQSIIYHCHYTGKSRGAAHNTCNLRCKKTKKIPVVFHNGSKYDYQFIINHLPKRI